MLKLAPPTTFQTAIPLALHKHKLTLKAQRNSSAVKKDHWVPARVQEKLLRRLKYHAHNSVSSIVKKDVHLETFRAEVVNHRQDENSTLAGDLRCT